MPSDFASRALTVAERRMACTSSSEAMAAGIPVITSRRDGMISMISDGNTGHLIDPDDTASMFELIVGLLHDEDRNRAIGDAARIEAHRRFSADALATLMIEKYAALSRKGG